MGDIIHALPSLSSLNLSFPACSIRWLVAPKWQELLIGNPALTGLIPFDRRSYSTLRSDVTSLWKQRPSVAIDFQGLIQSAIASRLSRPRIAIGWNYSSARESLASAFYTHQIASKAAHIVDKNLELASAVGATRLTTESWIPEGKPEGNLPESPFVLTNPFAGWTSKQWPLSRYEELAALLSKRGVQMVANVAPTQRSQIEQLRHVQVHSSSISGLIAATRQASAILGVDSGPLHLAAALHKPGVAIFGPTDPARNGPYRGTMRVLRSPNVQTTYKRHDEIHPSMLAISVGEVFDAMCDVSQF